MFYRGAFKFYIGQGRFLNLGHNVYFFQINSDKIRVRVATLYLRGLKFYIIYQLVPLRKFGKLYFPDCCKALFYSHDFMERGHKSGQNGAENRTL